MARRSAVRKTTKPGNFHTHKQGTHWCPRCRRAIERGDVTRFEEFYDDDGRFEVLTHKYCKEVRDRPRLPAPKAETKTLGGDYRRKIMATDETQDTVDEQETTDQPEAKASKKKSSKKSKKKSSKKSKKSSKKASSKKAKKDAGESRNTMANTVASRLAPHMEDVKAAQPALKNLADGDGSKVTHKQLETLRDEVNKRATELRAEGKTDVASELSAANALVRRLERQAR